jgi:L,D-transpeptidase ErfK/SrfK
MMGSFDRSRREVCAGLAAALALPASGAFAASPKPDKTEAAYPDMIGEVRHHIARHEDTLLDLARDNGLGYVEMIAANPGVDPWVPGIGAQVVLPTAHLLPAGPREGILLNVVDQRLYYFPPDGKPVESYPVGTSREAWDTPLGTTKIVRKQADPTWYVPESIRKEDPSLPAVVPPGPDNPLGHHAFYLGWPAYLIHGTNRPYGVGRRVSRGCVRMYPEDIEELFPRVAIETMVTVVKQEMKIGWHKGELMLEVHPNLDQNLELEESGEFTPEPVPELAYRISRAAGDSIDRVNWHRVEEVSRLRTGIPVPILRDREIGLSADTRRPG